MKKLLLLGGLRYLIPVIKTAHELGYYVITCDYLPGNIAHKYADKNYNISILNKEEILNLAQTLSIDGIMSFAVDPGVTTAAYVAEKMKLPFAGSYKSVQILQNKDLFRQFLTENGFNVPTSGGYSDYISLLNDLNKFTFPVIVKPVDSAGSKGVTRVDNQNDLHEAVKEALNNSLSKRFIVEDFIKQKGYSSDSDCLSINGKLVFSSFSDQLFDSKASNPYTPAAYIWPNSMNRETLHELNQEIQRLFKLLNLQSSIYNIETRVDFNDIPYIMEVSPRGGGNRISEILLKATGVDLISSAIQMAVGDRISFPTDYSYDGVWAELILHADKEGYFSHLQVPEEFQQYIVETDLWIKKGDKVFAFTGANETIGTLVFRFNSREELEINWKRIEKKVKVVLI